MKKQVKLMLCAFVASCFVSVYANQPAAEPKVYTVMEMIEQAPNLVGQTVQIKGTAQHVCATSGRKLFLSAPDGKRTFRVNAGKAFAKFDKEIVKKEVIATGVVAETKLTLEDLDKQEAAAIEAEKTKKEAHCNSEAKAEGLDLKATPIQRIQMQREKIKKQVAEGKKNYLSFYTINKCTEYKVVTE